MKKLLALLLVALMAVSLVACVPTPGDLNDIVNNAINDLENDVNSNDNGNGLDINIGDDDDDDNDDNDQDSVSVNINGSVTEQVVYNENDIKVTVEELTYEEYSGPTLSFLVENNSDKDITVSSQNVTVNNIVFSAYMYADVNSGKKSYEEMSFYESDLISYGITEIGKIEFSFNIYEQETYDDIDDSDIITLVVNDKVEFVPVPKGEKIYSENGITIYTEKCDREDDDYYDYVTRFFVVNESDKYATIRCEDVSVNGFMIDPYCSVSVPAGKMAYTNLYFYESDLESNKIDDIEVVEFYFDIFDYNTYDDIDESDTITINVN